MKFKLLCSDLDGTLLSTKSDVSDFTISKINQIKNDIRVILVSARMPSGMYYIQQSLGIQEQAIICYNGALVLSGGEELLSVYIPINIVKNIYTLCNLFKVDVGLYVNDEWFVPNSSERVIKETKYTKTKPIFMPSPMVIDYINKKNLGAHKLMLMCTKQSADAIMPILQEKFNPYVNLYRSNDTLIEIAPKSVSKLSAIELLLKPNETLEEVIAFGDNYNDIEMLKKVGTGVAVKNARIEVKAIANYTADENTKDGVARFIEQHLVN